MLDDPTKAIRSSIIIILLRSNVDSRTTLFYNLRFNGGYWRNLFKSPRTNGKHARTDCFITQNLNVQSITLHKHYIRFSPIKRGKLENNTLPQRFVTYPKHVQMVLSTRQSFRTEEYIRCGFRFYIRKCTVSVKLKTKKQNKPTLCGIVSVTYSQRPFSLAPPFHDLQLHDIQS